MDCIVTITNRTLYGLHRNMPLTDYITEIVNVCGSRFTKDKIKKRLLRSKFLLVNSNKSLLSKLSNIDLDWYAISRQEMMKKLEFNSIKIDIYTSKLSNLLIEAFTEAMVIAGLTDNLNKEYVIKLMYQSIDKYIKEI